jgi:hypothetical protein
MSSKRAWRAKCLRTGYFGRIVGSPPGLPGGGITGVLPVSGVGARIAGSTPAGGQSTPSDLASLSPSGSSARWPVVVPCGAILPCGVDSVGAQAARAGAGGAVWAGGVAGVGGACANAALEFTMIAQDRKRRLLVMQGNGWRRGRFRTKSLQDYDLR